MTGSKVLVIGSKPFRIPHTVALLILLFFIAGARGQQDSYILKRETYRTGLASINMSPDGSLLLAGFRDGSFRLLDPESFEVRLEVEDAHFKGVNAMDMPPGMEYIMTAGHSSIKLWEPSGEHRADWPAHSTTIWNAEISSDGKYAVSSAFNRTFLLWDAVNGDLLERMRGHDDVTLSVAISPDNRRIASGSNDQTIRIWDLETRRPVKTLQGPAGDVYDLAFSPDSRLLAVTSQDENVRIYVPEEETMLHLLKGHRDMVMEVAFSPDGRYLLSTSADHSVALWDVSTGKKIHSFLDNEDAVTDVVFHPDKNSFYTISLAGDLTRWNMHPEIFVLGFYEKPYLEEIAADPIFEPRRNGESRKEYRARLERASVKKKQIIDRYYRRYLSEHKQ